MFDDETEGRLAERAGAPSAIPPDTGELSRREAGKAERRKRIIRAARTLIRETGDSGLSMRALAEEAGVSLVTPYNLFGSKQAIILALLDDVRDFLDQFDARRPADPLEALFTGIDMAVDLYVADERFYRALWSAIFDTTNATRKELYNPKRDAFWKSLLIDLSQAGALDDIIDINVLLHQLDHQFRSIMLDWVVHDISSEALAPTARLGAAVILRGVAAPATHARLGETIRRDHELVSALAMKADPLTVLPTRN